MRTYYRATRVHECEAWGWLLSLSLGRSDCGTYAIIRDLPSFPVSLPCTAQSELHIRAQFQSDLPGSVIVDSKDKNDENLQTMTKKQITTHRLSERGRRRGRDRRQRSESRSNT